MRILHTSDWHLGHSLHGIGRDSEHAAFMDWLLERLYTETVDVLMIAGDIFDSSNPPASAQQAWYRFLVNAVTARPGLQIVVIGGNHDSAARLDAPKPLLDSLDITMVGGLPRIPGRIQDAGAMAIPLKDTDGNVAAWCAAMPFIRVADMPSVRGASQADRIAAGVQLLYKDLYEHIEDLRQPGQALVAMGHCYMSGGRMCEGSERKIHMGQQEALAPTLFPNHLAYVALGHLHRPQMVRDQTWVRYCGSPIPLSADEWVYGQQVNLVELEGERLVSVREIPVPRTIDLIALPKQSLADTLAALAALERLDPEMPEDRRPFLTVHVDMADPIAGLQRKILGELEGKAPRLLKVKVTWADKGDALADVEGRRSLEDMAPEDVFVKCYRQSYENNPPDNLLGLFHELMDQTAGGEP